MKTIPGYMTNLVKHYNNCYTIEFYTCKTENANPKIVRSYKEINESEAERIMLKANIDQDELEMAFEALALEDNLVANFGMFGTFLTTFKRQVVH